MNFDETIRLQALRLKQLNSMGHIGADGIVDQLLANAPENGAFRNICASVSQQLFDEVNGICDVLDISKRRFVEMALIEAIKKSNEIMIDVQPFDQEPA